MPKIFISYRRADSLKDAGRIYDRLVEAFGRENVFKDVDSIPLGKDFRGILREAVARCDVQLAIIGKLWLNVRDSEGKRRLDNPDDFVRIEIETALQRDSCLVIPVQVDSASMPSPDELPLALRELAFKNATLVRDDPDFHKDVDKIIRELQTAFDEDEEVVVKAKPSTSSYNVNEAIKNFFEAFSTKDWEEARRVLTEIRSSGKAPRVFKVDEHEQDVWAAIQEEERDNEYGTLRLMQANPSRLWSALQEFWQMYPDYDPDNLARFKPQEPKRQEPEQQKIIPSAPKPQEPKVEAAVDVNMKNAANDDSNHFNLQRYPVDTSVKQESLLPEPVDTIASGKEESLLPEPFDWCEIPAGKVTIKGKTQIVHDFLIAKFPITNAQFAKFIDAGGYKNNKWWTMAGLEQKEINGWTEPEYWRDRDFNKAEQPVIGVSWYESIAFCLWLSEVSGEKIMLPREHQRQRAAQGDDGRAYPWGNDWDAHRCNNNVNKKGIGKTSPVRYYESRGTSPFGVVDLAGNIWEWCLNEYETGNTGLDGANVRVLRGGSWFNNLTQNFRVDMRNWSLSDNRFNTIGFRIASLLD